MPYADLHVHTTRSDGCLELAAVPDVARRAGVSVVAITDHDRVQPFDKPRIVRDGITIVHGIELRVECDTGLRVDLLGYGIDPTDELVAMTDRIQTNRIERGQEIVDCVEDETGVDLGVTVTGGFGRPHIARAVDDHPELVENYREAFDDLIGADCPCFVPRAVPSFERGRAVLTAAADIVSLAHPLRYRDPERALGLASELDAVERWYPYDRDVDRRLVERTIDRYDLLATGGTDAHGDRLGVAGLSKSQYDRLELTDH
ncbi:PHP domain-containing protein [Natrarchaeobius halalkaliphilus]|uniref:PHP domain-containing protein n=1 Tax=Natrarchaeobius halalkaliphilus TaxID=1679091 RepID=A0A3N6LK69_9EURY|nr:PHP domain-containing protein [Natrarchaeobius halalkaliphilus]RQG89143.1 PHP domain-containing protein [Natrarchaeobius halalkaliphilus]